MTGQPYFNILFPLSSQSPVASQVKPTKMSGSLCQAARPTPKKNNKKKETLSLPGTRKRRKAQIIKASALGQQQVCWSDRWEVTIPNSTIVTWPLAALQRSVGYYLGSSRRKTKTGHLLEAQRREYLPPTAFPPGDSEWEIRFSAKSVQPCWTQWCYANLHFMSW